MSFFFYCRHVVFFFFSKASASWSLTCVTIVIIYPTNIAHVPANWRIPLKVAEKIIFTKPPATKTNFFFRCKSKMNKCCKLGCVVCNMYYFFRCIFPTWLLCTQTHIALDPACNAHFVSTHTMYDKICNYDNICTLKKMLYYQ